MEYTGWCSNGFNVYGYSHECALCRLRGSTRRRRICCRWWRRWRRPGTASGGRKCKRAPGKYTRLGKTSLSILGTPGYSHRERDSFTTHTAHFLVEFTAPVHAVRFKKIAQQNRRRTHLNATTRSQGPRTRPPRLCQLLVCTAKSKLHRRRQLLIIYRAWATSGAPLPIHYCTASRINRSQAAVQYHSLKRGQLRDGSPTPSAPGIL